MDKTENIRQKIISITGPTATGKSSLAVMLAKKINGEIISADSRQVYKGFDIATAKAKMQDMGGIKHYLIDILEPNEEFSAGKFVEMAAAAIKEICARGKIPIIVGGTGLYLKMLLEGVDMPACSTDPKLRLELEKKTPAELYEILVELDSDFAKTLHPNDAYKVMRSVEILKTSKTTMAKSRGMKEKEYDVLKIALGANRREAIYDRINRRVEVMFDEGLGAEARAIFAAPTCRKIFSVTIGYQEFLPYFAGECDLNEVKEKIKQNTRHYAKRQLTWLRAQENVNWFNIDELSPEEIAEKVEKLACEFLNNNYKMSEYDCSNSLICRSEGKHQINKTQL